MNAASTEVAVALYARGHRHRSCRSRRARVAESCKLLENIFRSVNIALVNELKMIFDRMGIDVWEVIEAAKTKPFGFMPFYPGPGLGGHCIPLDPFYLVVEGGRVRRLDPLHRAGRRDQHPHAALRRRQDGRRRSTRTGKRSRARRCSCSGLSYKADIDDDRESPSYEIIELLQEAGAEVAYCDPFFPVARPGASTTSSWTSVPCTAEAFGQLRRGGAVDRPHRVPRPGAVRQRRPPGGHPQRREAARGQRDDAGEGVGAKSGEIRSGQISILRKSVPT